MTHKIQINPIKQRADYTARYLFNQSRINAVVNKTTHEDEFVKMLMPIIENHFKISTQKCLHINTKEAVPGISNPYCKDCGEIL